MDNKFAENLFKERKKILEILRDTHFTSLDDSIPHQQIIPKASYAPWLSDAQFLRIFDSIQDHTLVDVYRCYMLWDMLRGIAGDEGDVLEVGVWKGGTSLLMAHALKTGVGTLYMADTFSGVVNASEKDTLYKGGEHADTSTDIVRELFLKHNMIVADEQFIIGNFPANMLQTPFTKLKFVHIDVDTYLSAKQTFEFANNFLTPNAIVVFDDYGFWGCEGVTKFVNELKLNNSNLRVIYNLTGQAFVTRIKH